MGERTPAHERFFSKVTEDPNTGCWRFAGRPSGSGYIQFRPNGSAPKVYAHVWSYENLAGPIPDGFELDHACHSRHPSCFEGDNCPHRRCVNPAHLEPVSRRTNCIRATSRIATCRRGHPLTPANTYRDKRGWRSCRICRAEARQRWLARNSQQP